MQVLLRKNVANIGQKGEVKNVKKGYYFNYLLPQGIAVLANSDMFKKHEEVKARAVKKAKELAENAADIKKLIEKAKLVFTLKASGKKKTYGAVTEKDIIEKVKDELKLELNKDHFPEKEHLKELGKHEVPIELAKDVVATLKVELKEAK